VGYRGVTDQDGLGCDGADLCGLQADLGCEAGLEAWRVNRAAQILAEPAHIPALVLLLRDGTGCVPAIYVGAHDLAEFFQAE
jgi:hypothetical protein